MSAELHAAFVRACATSLVSLVLMAWATSAMACGACDEDSVAATYDHGVVEQAARAGDLVVYCRLDGRFDRRRLISAAQRVPGIRKGSIRVSAAPAALSFAVDSTRQTAPSAVAATARGLGAESRLQMLKVVSSPGSPNAT